MKKIYFLITFFIILFLGNIEKSNAQCCAILDSAFVTTPVLSMPSGSSGTNSSLIIYNAGSSKYYASFIGNLSFTMCTFSNTGTLLNQTTAGFDCRGGWYNPNLNTYEANGYNALGLHIFDTNATGYLLNTGTSVYTGMNQPNSQSVGDYDYANNYVIYYNSGYIYRYNRVNGTLVSTTALPTGITSANLNTYSIYYIGCSGHEYAVFDYVNKAVKFIDINSWTLSGTSYLPATAYVSNNFSTSYSNGKLWIFNVSTKVWTPYQIIGPTSVGVSIDTITQHICFGNNYQFGDSLITTDVSNLTDTFTNLGGCDSVVTLNLTFGTAPLLVEDIDSGCVSLVYNDSTYYANFEKTDTFKNTNQCDSLYHHVKLTVFPSSPYILNKDSLVCSNSFDWYGSEIRNDTTLSDTLINKWGCDSVYRTLRFIIDTFAIKGSISPDTPYTQETFAINTTGNQNYTTHWLPENLFPNQFNHNQYLSLDDSILHFIVYATDDRGCKDTLDSIIILKPIITNFGIPNAFSPNGDGVNDRFNLRFYISRGYKINNFRIFNRFGQVVYHQSGVTEISWDGTFNQKPCELGTYYYVGEIEFVNGEKSKLKGDILLLR